MPLKILPITAVPCYGPSVISVTVTKGGHPKSGGLYKTSKTIEQRVSRVT